MSGGETESGRARNSVCLSSLLITQSAPKSQFWVIFANVRLHCSLCVASRSMMVLSSPQTVAEGWSALSVRSLPRAS